MNKIRKTKELNNKKTVLLGLSGGVDSAVSAILLKKQGYIVIAAFLKCFSDTKDPLTGECSWLKDKKDAQKIASKLKIPFIMIDLEKEYKKEVIKPMLKSYARGLTPNPDINCNTIIKFPWLWKYAKKYKASYIATGHYARIKKTSKEYELLSGKDKNKDQSYFLYELSQKDLSHTLFPVGELKKEQVRKIAKKNNLPVWNKHGTRGICFVGKVNMQNFLQKTIPKKQGAIKSPEGKVIGTHPGSSYFTIGQRAHPSLDMIFRKTKEDNKKWYIANKINNTLIIAPENHKSLFKSNITLNNLYLISPSNILNKRVKARIRHLGQFIKGKLTKQDNIYIFKLKEAISGIAPGQSIVFYQGNRVIGGGIIKYAH